MLLFEGTTFFHVIVRRCIFSLLTREKTNSLSMCVCLRGEAVLQSKLNSEPEMGVEHLSDLNYPDADPPCHFCCHQTSTAVHDENRLTIMSRGRKSIFSHSLSVSQLQSVSPSLSSWWSLNVCRSCARCNHVSEWENSTPSFFSIWPVLTLDQAKCVLWLREISEKS